MARILLIDDDDSFRTPLRLMLTHSGHFVIEARNGKEGLAMFTHADADLVITDIVMPEKEGLEVLMGLRKKEPPVKIIAISGGGARERSGLSPNRTADGRGEGAGQAVSQRSAARGHRRTAGGRLQS
jgi:CheY-like chemotaxis protein